MVIKTAEFVKSSGKWQECPEPILPEYAFIGRSNVGKSSLINAMMNHKDLAKTSQTPVSYTHLDVYKRQSSN